MEKFNKLTGIAAPMPLVNIDTDMIIPKQFLKTIKRSGLGANLFDEIDKEKMPTLATTQNIFMRHFNDQISNDGGETKIQSSKATMLHCAQAAFQDLKEELSESKKSLRRFKFSSTDSDIELQQKTLKTITNGSALKLKYESDEEVEF